MQIQGLPNIQIQPGQKLQTSTPLSNAAPGDTITATVTSAEGGRVTLTLPDGTALSAGQQASEALLPGDTVQLQVQSTGERGTSLRLVEVNGQPLRAEVPQLEYALMRMQVPANSTHVAFARVLQDLGLTLSPKTLARMGDIIKQFPDISPAQAAFFATSELPITESNLRAFTEFAQNPLNASAFTEAVEQLMQADPAAARIMLALQIADSLPASTQAQPAVMQGAPPSASASGGEAIPLPQGLSNEVAAQLVQSGDWTALVQDAPEYTDVQARDALLSFLTSLPQEATASDRQLLLNAFQQARAQQDAPAQQPQQGERAQPAAQLPVQDGAAALPARETLPLEQVVKSMFALVEQGDADTPQKLREATSSLSQRVLALSDALAQSGGTGAKSAVQIGNALVTQLQMGNELNNLLYAQIPFQLTQEDRQTAELYVLKRGRSARPLDDENATIALCLETQTMGRLETLLRVEQNEMTLQFRVEGEKVQRYVKDQLYRLRALEFPAQYRLKQAGVVLQKEAITPLNAGKTMQQAFSLQQTGMLDLTV